MTIEISSGSDIREIEKLIYQVRDDNPDAFGNEDWFYDEVFLRYYKQLSGGDCYFEELAMKLRELWPPGEKDGKYPWRDSVSNLVKRLKALWGIRGLPEYPIETCLTVARRYLSQFEDNAKYMKTLKYFILRQNDKVVEKDGRVRYSDQSTFADMLEGSTDSDSTEWENLFNDTGDLV